MTDLLLVTALRTEWLALRDQVPGARLERCGMGPRHVADWVRDWPTDDVPGAVVVAGVAGGLAPDVEAGDVVVASEVRDGERSVLLPGAAPLVAALRAAGLTVHHAPILTTPRVVTGSRSELAAGGLAAVDMESMPLVRAALQRGVGPVAVVRVVVDTAHSPIGRLATVTAGARALAILRRVGPLLGAWAELATTPRRALLAGPRSFCAGVDRAIEIVERALRIYPHPVYVRRQIVHNQHVVDDLRARGAVFVEELDDLPDNLPSGTAVVLSAHGVAPAVREDAQNRGLTVVDATCPLVAKVHAEAKRFLARDDTVLFIGHDHHDETEGTLGEAPGQIQLVTTPDDAAQVEVRDPAKVSYLMQTTLAMDEAGAVVDALRQRFPLLADPPSDDICYATTNRQQAVRAVARDSDVVLVLGSANSSNSLRLVEVAAREGVPAHLIEDADAIRPEWLSGRRTVGVTAGASAPPHLVDEVVATLRAFGPVEVEERTVAREDVRFTVPKEVAI